MSIEIQGVSKHFGAFAALRDVSLNVGAGELVALLGPSGCGKTTLLRIIAGLETADPGGGAVRLSCGARADGRIGFVFQHYALFRHMTVFENVAFGLRVRRGPRRLPEEVVREKVRALLRLVQLEAFAGHYPRQLSGGQCQRVALARALAVEPEALLLDEPFGSLDTQVRLELRRWLRRLHETIRITTVFVTHDQEEALELADRIVVLNAGRVEQAGRPAEVFHEPASEFVMNFLGQVNLFEGRLVEGRPMFSGPENAAPVRICARPHELHIETRRDGGSTVPGTVTRLLDLGAHVRMEVRGAQGQAWHVELSPERFRELGLRDGQEVWLRPRRFRVFSVPGSGRGEPFDAGEEPS